MVGRDSNRPNEYPMIGSADSGRYSLTLIQVRAKTGETVVEPLTRNELLDFVHLYNKLKFSENLQSPSPFPHQSTRVDSAVE